MRDKIRRDCVHLNCSNCYYREVCSEGSGCHTIANTLATALSNTTRERRRKMNMSKNVGTLKIATKPL